MGYYVSMEMQLKTKKTAAEIRTILEQGDLIFVPEAEITSKGTYRYLNYKACDFKLSQESEAVLLLMLLDLEPVHKPNNGRQQPNLVFFDDMECRSWGYIISYGQIQPMTTVWDYDTQAKPLNRAALLSRLQPVPLE